MRRSAIVPCLVFSGLTALVYQIIWTRLLGFTFGTTTEAIATVLAVFFAGMALGNLVAARTLARVARPLRVYALLELAIGAFAMLSLPLLRALPGVWAWLDASATPQSVAAARIGLASLVLLPPTVAMGATLPVVARGLVNDDGTLGRWSAILYAANTFGAVLGAYLCGFWLVPELGLTRAVVAAGLVNLGVAAFVLVAAGTLRVPATPRSTSSGAPEADPAGRGTSAAFLFFFGVSGLSPASWRSATRSSGRRCSES
jgi:spermidine synthase